MRSNSTKTPIASLSKRPPLVSTLWTRAGSASSLVKRRHLLRPLRRHRRRPGRGAGHAEGAEQALDPAVCKIKWQRRRGGRSTGRTGGRRSCDKTMGHCRVDFCTIKRKPGSKGAFFLFVCNMWCVMAIGAPAFARVAQEPPSQCIQSLIIHPSARPQADATRVVKLPSLLPVGLRW
jgi:hypothetical protein